MGNYEENKAIQIFRHTQPGPICRRTLLPVEDTGIPTFPRAPNTDKVKIMKRPKCAWTDERIGDLLQREKVNLVIKKHTENLSQQHGRK